MNIYYLYWLISIVCSFLLSIGFYGYGIDYYAIYYKSVWGYGHILDYLGMYLVGIHLQNISLGIFSVSMLQYCVYYLLFKDNSKRFFWSAIAIILSFGWAHFMQSLNMLRQGLSINIFLIFFLLTKTKLLLLVVHIFSHKISAITIPILLVFRVVKSNYFSLLFSRIILIASLSFILPTLSTPVRGIDLSLFIVCVIVVSECFIVQERSNYLTNKNVLLVFANTAVLYFLVNGQSAYAERLFLSFFPVYFFLLTAKLKKDPLGIFAIFSTACLYVGISWFIGPLATLT